MNLVIGATGQLGFEVCRLLRNQGKEVRAVVRKTFQNEKATRLREMGVQLVQADLRNKKSFAPVLKGVHKVVATASSMPNAYVEGENDIRLVDKNGMMDFILAAKEANIRHFIYTSFSGNISIDFPLRNAKRTVEQYLRKSGLTFTILRPGFLLESWLSPEWGFDSEKARAQIFGTESQPVSYISVLDVARFAVAALHNPYARNLILELGGPENLSQLEVVNIFEEAVGTGFTLEYISEEELRYQMDQTADPMQKSIFGLKLALAHGGTIDMVQTQKAFHLPLTSIREYALQQHVRVKNP